MEKTERAALDSTKRYVGIILNINVSRNFGFICPNWTAPGDDDNIFFHFNGSEDIEKNPFLQVGTKVIFSVKEDDHGVPMAFKVRAYDESVVVTDERPDMPDSKTIKMMRQEARKAKKDARKAAREASRLSRQVTLEQQPTVEVTEEAEPLIIENNAPLQEELDETEVIEEIMEGSDDELDESFMNYDLDGYEEYYKHYNKMPRRLNKKKIRGNKRDSHNKGGDW